MNTLRISVAFTQTRIKARMNSGPELRIRITPDTGSSKDDFVLALEFDSPGAFESFYEVLGWELDKLRRNEISPVGPLEALVAAFPRIQVEKE